MKSKKSGTQSKFLKIAAKSWDVGALRLLLAKMRKKRILVVGDLGVDRYTEGTVERICPEAPVPILHVSRETLKLGLGANVADNIRVLDGEVLLIGVVGADRTGEDFKRLMRTAGINPAHLVVDRKRRTVLKERLVTSQQQILRVDYEDLLPIAPATTGKVLRKTRNLISKVDAVIVQDYQKGMFSGDTARKLIALVRKRKGIVTVDPHPKAKSVSYRGAMVLTPNIKEAEALARVPITDDDSLDIAGRRILREAGAEHVVITRGKDGMAIFTAGKSVVYLIPTYAREVFDVSGAGDTVIAVLTLALSAGGSIQEAAILGNLAAGVEVGKRGTATVTANEILEMMDVMRR